MAIAALCDDSGSFGPPSRGALAQPPCPEHRCEATKQVAMKVPHQTHGSTSQTIGSEMHGP
jgi:hypothetical protein